jgi:hypothetical protein
MNASDQVKAAVTDFVRGGDTNDIRLLDKVLHSDFQNVQDGFFEDKGVFIFSKEKYKKLVETKRFGGSGRSIVFNSVEILGDLAYVRVRLESEVLVFNSILLLGNEAGSWKVIHNVPTIVRK